MTTFSLYTSKYDIYIENGPNIFSPRDCMTYQPYVNGESDGFLAFITAVTRGTVLLLTSRVLPIYHVYTYNSIYPMVKITVCARQLCLE